MCGIAGWLSYSEDLNRRRDVLERMNETMALRGPDAGGIWVDGNIGLCHRRLSIIDINGGRQPMVAMRSGQQTPVVLTYSGEVYNFAELRRHLESEGYQFATRSDTEVVLKAYLHWGEEFVDRLNGMYAFAIWDASARELLLVRDRLGVKPLFYYETSDGVVFGSEPKAILANPIVPRRLDADGFREILEMVKTPGKSVFAGVHEVLPGQFVRVGPKGLRTRSYWKLEARDHGDSLTATVRHTRDLLEDILAHQIVSDVPLCSLLSGGLDSSIVTALASKNLALLKTEWVTGLTGHAH